MSLAEDESTRVYVGFWTRYASTLWCAGVMLHNGAANVFGLQGLEASEERPSSEAMKMKLDSVFELAPYARAEAVFTLVRRASGTEVRCGQRERLIVICSWTRDRGFSYHVTLHDTRTPYPDFIAADSIYFADRFDVNKTSLGTTISFVDRLSGVVLSLGPSEPPAPGVWSYVVAKPEVAFFFDVVPAGV